MPTRTIIYASKIVLIPFMTMDLQEGVWQAVQHLIMDTIMPQKKSVF